MTAQSVSVESMLQSVSEAANGNECTSVGDVVRTLNFRGYGAFLLVPSLMEISPLGALPVVPTLLALVVSIFAAQMVVGREEIWLPNKFRRREISTDRLQVAINKIQPVARWLDRWFHKRLPVLTGPVPVRLAAACCVLLCLTVPPLELVPFASSAPMVAIAVFGLAITVDDGLLMLLGFLLTGGAVAIVATSF